MRGEAARPHFQFAEAPAGWNSSELPGREINHNDGQEKHDHLQPFGPGVQRVELDAGGIGFGNTVNLTDGSAQGGHPGRDPELRDDREQQHKAQQDMAQRERMS